VLGVEEVPREHTRQYGIVQTDGGEPGAVRAIVEKPRPEEAPSNLAVVGRYILSPRIFHHLASVQAGAGGEIQLTDGIAALLREEKVLAYRLKGIRYDCGSKLGYLQAMVAYGQKHPEVGAAFSAYLKSL
jgi:UTP--glucose-1-phosphate uridylyltransferase